MEARFRYWCRGIIPFSRDSVWRLWVARRRIKVFRYGDVYLIVMLGVIVIVFGMVHPSLDIMVHMTQHVSCVECCHWSNVADYYILNSYTNIFQYAIVISPMPNHHMTWHHIIFRASSNSSAVIWEKTLIWTTTINWYQLLWWRTSMMICSSLEQCNGHEWMRDVTHTMLNVEKHKINWDWGDWGECYNKHHIFHIMIEFGSSMMGGKVEDIIEGRSRADAKCWRGQQARV